MNEVLVGLGGVEVCSAQERAGELLRVGVRYTTPRLLCGSCGGPLWSDGDKAVELAGSAVVREVCAAGAAGADGAATQLRGTLRALSPSRPR